MLSRLEQSSPFSCISGKWREKKRRGREKKKRLKIKSKRYKMKLSSDSADDFGESTTTTTTKTGFRSNQKRDPKVGDASICPKKGEQRSSRVN